MSPEVLSLSQIRDSNPAYKGISDDGLFNHIHDKYYSDVPRDVLAKEVGYEFPDKPISDDLKNAIHQGAGGVNVDFNKAVGNAAQAFSPEDSAVTDWGKGVVERADARAKDYLPDNEGRGLLAESVASGARAIPLSLSTLPAYALGPVVGGAATAALFGGSAYQEEYDRLKALGKSDEDAHNAGLAVGSINGLGEVASAHLSLGMLGVGKKAVADTIGGLIGKSTDDAILKPLATSYAKTLVGENLTENTQTAGQEAVERAYGAGQQGYLEGAIDTTKATSAMVSLLGPLGIPAHIAHSNQAKAVNEILSNPDSANKDERMAVVDMLHQDAKKNGIGDADAWLAGATNDVNNGVAVRRNSESTISDIGSATNVDDAISAAGNVVNGATISPNDVNTPEQNNTSDYTSVFEGKDAQNSKHLSDEDINNLLRETNGLLGEPETTRLDAINNGLYKDTNYVPLGDPSLSSPRTGFGLQDELANLASVESKDKTAHVNGLLAEQALQRDEEAKLNAAINNPSLVAKSGIGQLSEFSNFAEQQRKLTQDNRLKILKSVLDDDSVTNKQAKFEADIKRSGYTDTNLTPFEVEHLGKHIDLLSAKDALEQNRVPSSPNEQDFYEQQKTKEAGKAATSQSELSGTGSVLSGRLPGGAGLSSGNVGGLSKQDQAKFEPDLHDSGGVLSEQLSNPDAIVNRNTKKPFFSTITSANKILSGDIYPETSDTHDVVKVGKLFQVIPKPEKQDEAKSTNAEEGLLKPENYDYLSSEDKPLKKIEGNNYVDHLGENVTEDYATKASQEEIQKAISDIKPETTPPTLKQSLSNGQRGYSAPLEVPNNAEPENLNNKIREAQGNASKHKLVTGDVNIYTPDIKSSITGHGKHNRLIVFHDVKDNTIDVREDYQGLPMSTEQDRRMATDGEQRLHGKSTKLTLQSVDQDGSSVWYRYGIKQLTKPQQKTQPSESVESPTPKSLGDSNLNESKNEPAITEADLSEFMQSEAGLPISKQLSEIRSQINAFENFKNCIGGK